MNYFVPRLRRAAFRCVCHFCSSRSISPLGTATMRFVRFDSRSIGVLPGTDIFTGASLIESGSSPRDAFALSPRFDSAQYVCLTALIRARNIGQGHAAIALHDRLSSKFDQPGGSLKFPSRALFLEHELERRSLRLQIAQRVLDYVQLLKQGINLRATVSHVSESFCLVSIAAWTSQHVSGSSLPVRAV